MNPLARQIQKSLESKYETKLTIVKRLGYKNQNKGLRRLEQFINTGECSELFKEKLAQVLELDSRIIQNASNNLKFRQSMDEESKRLRNFQPHLWIIHELEKPPLGCICIVGLLGLEYFKKILLPGDISIRSWSAQFKFVRDKIKEHQQKEVVDTKIFGDVSGYI